MTIRTAVNITHRLSPERTVVLQPMADGRSYFAKIVTNKGLRGDNESMLETSILRGLSSENAAARLFWELLVPTGRKQALRELWEKIVKNGGPSRSPPTDAGTWGSHGTASSDGTESADASTVSSDTRDYTGLPGIQSLVAGSMTDTPTSGTSSTAGDSTIQSPSGRGTGPRKSRMSR